MNSKIENSYKWKLNTLNKRRETQEKKSELLKETHRSKSEKQYQTKLKRLEKRREYQYKNIVRKEKWKPLKEKIKEIPIVPKIDSVFSKYMRLKYWDKCCTCNKKATWFWHYITRMCRALRRDERNGWPQWFFCCNSKNTGNGRPQEMEVYLINRWVNIEELKSKYHQWKMNPEKPKKQELKELLEYRESKYKKLLSHGNK